MPVQGGSPAWGETSTCATPTRVLLGEAYVGPLMCFTPRLGAAGRAGDDRQAYAGSLVSRKGLVRQDDQCRWPRPIRHLRARPRQRCGIRSVGPALARGDGFSVR